MPLKCYHRAVRFGGIRLDLTGRPLAPHYIAWDGMFGRGGLLPAVQAPHWIIPCPGQLFIWPMLHNVGGEECACMPIHGANATACCVCRTSWINAAVRGGGGYIRNLSHE